MALIRSRRVRAFALAGTVSTDDSSPRSAKTPMQEPVERECQPMRGACV